MMESTVNRYLAVISQLFHKVVEWDWLVKVPCRAVKYWRKNDVWMPMITSHCYE